MTYRQKPDWRIALIAGGVLGLVLTVNLEMTRRITAEKEQAAMDVQYGIARHEARMAAARWQAQLAAIQLLHIDLDPLARAALTGRPKMAERKAAIARSLDTLKPELDDAAIYGVDGTLLWSSNTGAKLPGDLLMRPDFSALLSSHTDRMTGTAVMDDQSRQWELHDLRLIRSVDGSPLAVSVVEIGASVLGDMRRYLDDGGPQEIGVVRDDGAVLIWEPEYTPGAVLAPDNIVLREALDRGHAEGIRVKRSDGRTCLSAYERIPGSDTLVGVGYYVDEFMAPVRLAQRRTETAAAIISALQVILTIAALIGLEQRRRIKLRQQMMERIAHENALLEGIGDQASDKVVLLDREFRYKYANSAFHQAIGLPREAVIGRVCGAFTDPDDQPAIA